MPELVGHDLKPPLRILPDAVQRVACVAAMRRPLLLTPLLLIVSASALAAIAPAAGTPESAKSPNQILHDLAVATRKITSWHMAGYSLDKSGRTTVVGDSNYAGTVAQGTTTLGKLRLTAKDVDGAEYYKGNTAFWRQAKASTTKAAALAAQWVKVPVTKYSTLGESLSPKSAADCALHGNGTLSKTIETIGGQRLIVLTDAGDKPGTSPGRVYITASAPLRVLRVTQTGPSRPGGHFVAECDDTGKDTTKSADIRISRFDEPIDVTAPTSFLDASKTDGSGSKPL